jgi:hypothetical protein
LVVLMLLGGSVLVWLLLRVVIDPAAPPAFVLPGVLASGAVGIVVLGRQRGPMAGSVGIAAVTACAVGYAAFAILPELMALQAVPQLGTRIAATTGPAARVGQYGSAVSAGLVYYARHRVELLTSADAAAQFLRGPGEAYLVLPRPDAQAIAALAPDAAHEMATSARLVVRLDRLFGDRSPYEDGLVVLSNRSTYAARPESRAPSYSHTRP